MRRVIATIALVVTALVGTAWAASADSGSSGYPAPVAQPSGYPAPSASQTSIQVLAESSSVAPASSSAAAVAGPSSAPTDGLAYTGVSFNVTLVVTIAALTLLVGVSLVVLGARSVARSRSRH